MLKQLLLGLLLALSINGMAQFNSFTFTVTPSPESCTNNGTLAFDTVGKGITSGSTVVFSIYKSPNFVTALATTSNLSYGGLTSGSYRVSATQTLGANSNSFTVNTTVANTKPAPLTFTTTVVDEICPFEGEITVNVTAGSPAFYALTAGPVLHPNQTSNVFDSLPIGTYTVSVTDVCGDVRVQNVGVVKKTPSMSISQVKDIIQGCTSVALETRFTVPSGMVAPGPFQVKYTIYRSNLMDTVIITKPNVYPNPLITNYTTGFNILHDSILRYSNGFYDVEFIGRCGSSVSQKHIAFRKMTVNTNIIPAQCDKTYLRMNVSDAFKKFTINFTSVPAGFNPSDFNTTYPGAYTVTGSSFVPVNFGGLNHPVPPGNYSFEITDSCGQTLQYTTSVYNYLLQPSFFNLPGCDSGMTSVGIYSLPLNVDSVSVINAPANFQHPLPWVISDSVNHTNGDLVLTNIPGGNYTLRFVDSCNNVLVKSYTFTGLTLSYDSIQIIKKCGTFDVIVPSFTTNNSNASLRLQKYNTSTNTWTEIKILSVGQNLNIQSTGHFRILYKLPVYVSAFPSRRTQECSQVIKEFEYTTTITITDVYAFQCANGTTDVGLNATGGIGSLKYRITTRNGAAFLVQNGTNPLFTGLSAGVYNFQIEDSCGNLMNTQHDITTLSYPKITPLSLCDGSNGQLSVNGVPYLNFKWWKGTDTTTLSSNYNLPFTPFSVATDTGWYYVNLTTLNSGSCINDTLSFYISERINNPQAGLDTIIYLCANAGVSIDLNNYLRTPYDSYGQWKELSSSGYFNGSIFTNSLASPGVYQFQYKVLGLCSGADSSVVKVITNEQPKVFSYDTTICEGQTVSFHGTSYNATGIYTDTLHYVSGCDSIHYTLNLRIDSVKHYTYDTLICEGQTVSFHGTTYNATGIYTDTLHYASGCDSIRYTLNLRIDSVKQFRLC